MLSLLIWLIVIVAVFALVWWILGQFPVPPPMRIVVNIIFGVIALVVLLWFVSAVLGPPNFHHALNLISLSP